MIKKLENYCSIVLKAVLSILFLALVSVVFTQVVLRYAFASGLVWAEEASRYIFVWLMFFAIALGIRRKSHIAVTLLVDRLAPGRRIAPAFQALVTAGFFLVVVITGVTLMLSGRGAYSSVLRVEMFWVYLVMPVAGAFCVLLSLLQFVACLSNSREGAK